MVTRPAGRSFPRRTWSLSAIIVSGFRLRRRGRSGSVLPCGTPRGNGAFTQPVEVAGRQSSRPLWTSPGCSNDVAVTPARGFSLQRRCVSRGRAVDGVNAHLVFRESQCALPLAFFMPFQEPPAQQREFLDPNAISPD